MGLQQVGRCIMGLQRVGLVHNGTTAGLGWCIMGLQWVGLVHNGTIAGWAGA